MFATESNLTRMLTSARIMEHTLKHKVTPVVCACCSVQKIFSRGVVKSKYPPNPEKAAQLPVFEYPTSSPSERRVYVWGSTCHGALGNPKHIVKKLKECLWSPQRMPFAEQHKVTDIACGYGFTVLALKTKDNYKVYGTGINTDGQIGYHEVRRNHPLTNIVYPLPIRLPLKSADNTKVIQVAAGRAHLLVLTDNEGVFTMGNNAHGQCGRKIIDNEDYVKNHIIHKIRHLDDSPITSVECGQDHSLFINSKGEVYSCGWGADGQTGLGHYKEEWRPSRVVGDIQGEKIVKVACTADCNLAISDKGDVFGWGNAEYGQLLAECSQQVHTATYLKKCSNVGRVVDVASGGSSCLVLNDSGAVYTWGYGILGKGPQVQILNEPSQIPPTLFGWNEFNPDSKVVSVELGISHAAAITEAGDLYTWGHNRGACLGLGHTNDQYFPLKVSLGAAVRKVSLGVDHSVAICQAFV